MAGYRLAADPVQEWDDITFNFEQLAALLSGGSGQQAAVLQLLSTQKLQIQIGSAANLAVANGFNNIAVNLATPWPGQHILFLPFINGSNIFGSIEYVGSNTPSLNQGSILLQSSAAGTINVAYASFGN